MRNIKWIVLLTLMVLLLPWLGETLFNSKGEPREAIVAMSIIQSGDWVLPVSYGGDIPYKPPFLAWLIAIFAYIFNGGIVDEYVSRLPSALAAIGMVMAGYSWASRRIGQWPAAMMALVTITSFEVFRSAIMCRVDMVLTACMVCALYQMYEWRERHTPWRLVAIALLLSGAVLTKGPVGALLPCLAMGIYCLLRGDNFFFALAWLTGVCVVSMALPALWYWQAYLQGGDEFMRLALEENIGRLTGTMSYESHLNPWYYNVVTILSGMLPWTLLALGAAVVAIKHSARAQWAPRALVDRLRAMSAPSAFALTVALTVFVFYCLPASKRSVYLLPMYPMMAYGVALMLERMAQSATLRWYVRFLCFIAVLGPIAAIAMQWWHPAKMPIQPMVPWRYIFAIAPIALVAALRYTKRRDSITIDAVFITVSIYLAYAAAFQPMFLNGKSDIHALGKVEEAYRTYSPVYSYIEEPMMRYFTLNFYLNDRLRRIEDHQDTLQHLRRFSVLTQPDEAAAVDSMVPGWISKRTQIIDRSCDTRRPVMLITYRHPDEPATPRPRHKH